MVETQLERYFGPFDNLMIIVDMGCEGDHKKKKRESLT